MNLSQIPEVSEWTQSRTFAAGQSLFFEGETPRMIYQVRRGVVKYTRTSTGGREIIVGLAFPGDFVDVASTLDGLPYGVTATCLLGNEVEVIALPRELGLRCLALHQALERELLEELRWQRSAAAAMALERVEVRAMQTLELLARRLGQREGDGYRAPMVLTRQEFAALVGTTTETAIRVLSRLRSQGTIREENAWISFSQSALCAA